MERSIQELKKALEKCGPATTLNEITLILNGTARAGGYGSPLNIFMGRSVRTCIPNSQNREINIEENIKRREEQVRKWAKK